MNYPYDMTAQDIREFEEEYARIVESEFEEWIAYMEEEYIEDDYDGQPDEAQEWYDFNPEA